MWNFRFFAIITHPSIKSNFSNWLSYFFKKSKIQQINITLIKQQQHQQHKHNECGEKVVKWRDGFATKQLWPCKGLFIQNNIHQSPFNVNIYQATSGPLGIKPRMLMVRKFPFITSSSYLPPLSSDLHFQFPDATFCLIQNPYPIIHPLSSLLPSLCYHLLSCWFILKYNCR